VAVGGGVAARPLRPVPRTTGPAARPGRVPRRLGQTRPGGRAALPAVPLRTDPHRRDGEGLRVDDEVAEGRPAPGRGPGPGAGAGTAGGSGHNLSTDRIEERWLKPLADAALFFATHPKQPGLADAVMHQWQFQQTDEGRRVRRELTERLARGVAELPPERVA